MILVAHEDEAVARTVAGVLRFGEGWTSGTTDDVEQVLSLVRKETPDLLLISDGFGYFFPILHTTTCEVVQQIRRDPAIADLPIVILCYEGKAASKASNLGCTPLIVPVDPDELLAAIRRLIPTSVLPVA